MKLKSLPRSLPMGRAGGCFNRKAMIDNVTKRMNRDHKSCCNCFCCEPFRGIKIGQRIEMAPSCSWGQPGEMGTVSRFKDEFGKNPQIWVKWDLSGGETWHNASVHFQNLRLINDAS